MNLLNFADRIVENINAQNDMLIASIPDDRKKIMSEIISVMLDFPERPNDFRLDIYDSFPQYEHVILLSGGMDSMILWKTMKNIDNKIALFVDVGQKYARRELEVVRKFVKKEDLIIASKKIDTPEWEHIIPTRNFVLLLLAEMYCADNGKTYLGAVQGESPDNKGDKSELFFRLFEELIFLNNRKTIQIKTMKNKTKNDWLKYYLEISGNDLSILNTITCFKVTVANRKEPAGCGLCQACLRKWIAMKYCRLDTKGFFNSDPGNEHSIHVKKYKEKFSKALETNNFTHYSKDRCVQDLGVLNEYT